MKFLAPIERATSGELALAARGGNVLTRKRGTAIRISPAELTCFQHNSNAKFGGCTLFSGHKAPNQTALNRTSPGEKIGTVTSANRALSHPQGLSRCAADCPSIFSRRPAPDAAGQTTAVRNSPPPDPIALENLAVRGETIFAAIGCTRCHIPILFTGQDTNPVFDRRPVALYSDLLLHDVATGDGIPQAAALANEIRTPALWGLRFRRPFLHDGSAATPLEAILRHGNEAQTATTNYRELPTPDQDALVAFLDSL